MDLKDALKFITDLKEQADEPKVLEIDGKTYIDRNLTRYYKNDYPAALETYTLTSMVDYIKDLSDEIAAGRAALPANINHPEAEPMIIGSKFLVKINTNIGNSATSSTIEEEVEKAVWSCKWGGDTLMDLSTGTELVHFKRFVVQSDACLTVDQRTR